MSTPNTLVVPNTSTLRRRTIARGAMLVVKPLANFIGIPGIQDFVHHAQELIVALKPWALQTPEVNDMSAVGIITEVGKIAAIVGSAMDQLSGTDAAAACVKKLRLFTEYLEQVKTEIDQYQRLPYASKVALHGNMAALLAHHESELRLRTILLCLDSGLDTNHTLALAQRAIMQLQAQVTSLRVATGADMAVLKAQVAELHRLNDMNRASQWPRARSLFQLLVAYTIKLYH
ncbi:hypothetical protein BDV93DRAFT_543298 [Ceratobasidium sp. AG-I]|nr:hypothetical protein BDV93DRAFT_543298 [Ceratobasidium sp. AG-I]